MKKKFLKYFIIALLLEIFIFNINSYRTILKKYKVEKINNSYFSINDEKTYIEIDNIDEEVATIRCQFDSDVDDTAEYEIFCQDETSRAYYRLNSKTYINGNEKSEFIPVFLSGKVRKIAIKSEAFKNISEVSINEKIPFDFNFVRFFITFMILVVFYLLRNSKIFNSEYSSKNLKQNFFITGLVFICFCVICFNFLINLNRDDKNYMYDTDFVSSVSKGHLYLNNIKNDKLLKLENPYDPNERAETQLENGVDYYWDSAFYKGKTYIYFGILPLVLVLLPYYLITNSFLTIEILNLFLVLFIIILFRFVLDKLVERYFSKIKFKLYVFSYLMLVFGSLILYCIAMNRVYEMVILSGLLCVLVGLNFILKSLDIDKNKYLYIFAGCLFLALSVACRPTDLLISILILPYLIKLFIENKSNKSNLFKLIVSVGIPYIVVGILLMIYNYVRFDNPFEFGSNYQLTIMNMRDLENRGFYALHGFLINLFQFPIFTFDFPFLKHTIDAPVFYGYYYMGNMIGGLFFLAPICFMNFLIFKINKKTKNKELKIVINSLVFVGILIALISAVMAGSVGRYLVDYAWIFIISGILIFLEFYINFKSDETKKISESVLSFICVITILIGLSLGIISEQDKVEQFHKDIFYKIKYTCCFWE